MRAAVGVSDMHFLIRNGVMLALLLAGNAHAVEQPVRSLLETRQEGVVVQQWDTSCGAAALATVLTYTFDDPVPERFVAQEMLRRSDPSRVKARGGFSLLDLKRFAESRGYRAAGYAKLDLDQLLAMQAAIVPVDEFGDPHFVVVRGMKDGKLAIADPAFGNRALSREEFLRIWKQGIALAVTRRAER